ncbi:hypothetical protein Acica_44 [Acidovorax phage Acica]|nr:hypothetical protein Acica_44 [Acidovorax phage Acica]
MKKKVLDLSIKAMLENTTAAPAATQPEALRCAEWLEHIAQGGVVVSIKELARVTAEQLRLLHAALTAPAAEPAAPQAPVEGTVAGWKSHAEAMERERDYYRRRMQTMHEHQDGEVWYWQDDGEDHLESMVNSLPVVIRADQLRALLASARRLQPDAGAVPDGWRLVPVEPTEHMAMAGGQYAECGLPANAVFGYRAMIAAAPQVTTAPQAPAKATA